MLSVGIVGLPNVGKSSLFNALTAAGAAVSNYPFTTIDPNVGMVPVPDLRLARLEELLQPDETTPCFVRFTDIAGLVAGASRGEGLGNRFLGEIRGVDAIAHVVRAFEDPGVSHVFGDVDPVRDAEVVESELLLADLEVLERARERREREWKADPKGHVAERRRLDRWREALARGEPLRSLELSPEEASEAKALGLLTGKPLLWVVNVGEDDPGGAEIPAVVALAERGGSAVAVSARLEGELAELEGEEREELAAALGVEESGLERLAAAAFELLGLIRFYTVANDKLRAWELPRGSTAPEAAGRIHGDMEEGFIRARVAAYDDLVAAGGLAELARLGRLRTEGKEYVVRDGDLLEILFSG